MTETPQPSDLLTRLLYSDYVKLDGRFPVNDADELLNLVFELLANHQVARVPIIAMADGAIFAFAKAGEKIEHRQLMDNLAKLGYTDEIIAFTTALEFLSNNAPEWPYLKLETKKGEWFVKVKRTSDVINKPVNVDQLKKLFNGPGITVKG